MFTIYSTTNCAYCQMVKKIFKLEDVNYQEILVDNDKEKRQHAASISGMTTVPVVTKTVDGDESLICVGWNPGKLMSAIRT